MIPTPLRRALNRLGMTPYARSVFISIAGAERTLTIDGTKAHFRRQDFGDQIELNQIDAERQIITRLRQEAGGDDVFLDIGSNIGVFAVFVGEMIDEGEVVAVEAVPDTRQKLEYNLDRNRVSATVAPVAFSDKAEQLSLGVPEAHGSSTVTSEPTDERTVEVTAVPGDQFIKQGSFGVPNIIKIDVEGHECAVLRGLEETLQAPACRLVYCEVHTTGSTATDESPATPREILSDSGFRTNVALSLPGDRYMIRGVAPH